MVFIYGLRIPGTTEIRYVGKTATPQRRLGQHIRSARVCPKTKCHKWLRALLLRGLRPEMVILETTDREHWEAREEHWIQALRSGHRLMNLAPGGLASMAMLGKHHSAEARQRISAGNRGKGCSERTRLAVGAASHARRGLPRKPRPDLAERNRQRVWTDESRMLISTSRTGKSISREHRARLLEGHRKWREQRKDGDVR